MSILARAIYNPSGSIGSTSSISVDNAVPRYDGTTGLLLQNSGVTIDDSDNLTVPGNLVITGNLTVNGTTTTINVATLEIEDKNILVNKGGTTALSAGSGINIEGDAAAVVGYLRVATDTANLEFKASTGSILTVDINANKTLTVAGALNIEADSLINQDVTTDANVVFGTLTVNNSGIHILDTNASHDLILAVGSDLAADRTLTLTTGDADRIITLSGNPTLADWFDQEIKTTSSPTFAGLTFSSTGRRIIADLTNATHANRLLFQTATADSNSGLGIIPSGTGTTGAFITYGGSDPDNAAYAQFYATGSSHVGINSSKTGTGITQPIDFQIDGVSKARVTTGGEVQAIDTTTPVFSTASGSTNTGYFEAKGKTSGALRLSTADATAQILTLAAAAQTVGAATIYIPDVASVSDTVALTTLAQTLSNKTLASPTISGGTVTLSVDTNFVTSGGVNGFSVDTDTLSVDGANNRVGIGTTAPIAPLSMGGSTAGRQISIRDYSLSNDHQYEGFGRDTNQLIYQLSGATVDNVWRYGTSSSTSIELMRLYGGGGLTVGAAPTGGDQGAGTINISGDIYKNGALYTPTGSAVQVVNTQTGAVATGTTAIPNDDTIPQNTEGVEYMTLSITPTSASNTLYIEIQAVLSASPVSGMGTMALFQDSTANALAAVAWTNSYAANGQPTNVVLKHKMTAGTTSATTFKMRAGLFDTTTVTFNGSGGARLYGGVCVSSITITEVKV